MKTHRKFRSVLFLILVAVPSLATAGEIADSEFGFRLTIPDHFLELEKDASEPTTLYKYVDREPTLENPAIAIQVQRLEGLISVHSRIEPADIPEIEGITTTLQAFNWKGIDLDVMRQTIKLPTGTDYVVYGLQYPLSREAVQVQVGGPIEQDQAIYELFSQVAQSLSNTRPLHNPPDVAVGVLSKAERVQKLISGIVRLALTALVILVVFRFAKRALTKKKDGQETTTP